MSAAKLPSVIHETSMTWDHDTHTVLVDTNHRGVAGRLRRAGFEQYDEQPDDGGRLYRFRGKTGQVHFRPIRAKRKLTGDALEAARTRARRLRQADGAEDQGSI